MTDSVNFASGQLESPSKIGHAAQQASEDGSNFTRVQEYAPPSSFYSNECQTRLFEFSKKFKANVGKDSNTRDNNVANDAEQSGSDDDHAKMEMSGSLKDLKDQKSAKAPIDAQGCSEIVPLDQYISEVKGKFKNIQQAYAEISNKCGRGAKSVSDNKKIMKIGSHVKQEGQANLVREMSIEILTSSEGCVPVIKSFESDAFSNQSFVKDIKFYNKNDMKFKTHFVVDKGFLDISYKTKDISTLHFKNYVFFYQRENDMFKLIQYDCINHEHKELPGYEIREPNSEYRYHLLFSRQFGNNLKELNKLDSVHDFLGKQFVFAQVYKIEQKERSSKRYVHQQIFAWRMQYMAQAESQYGNIQAPGGQARILSDPLQYICHIKQGSQISFVAIDPFCTHEFFIEHETAQSYSDITSYPCNNEYQVQNSDRVSDPEVDYNDRENRGRDAEEMKTECKHRDYFPFLKMPNPEFIIQKMKMGTQDQAFDQYYYLTTDHQIQLIYPNHINMQQKANYMSHIAKVLKNEKTNMIKYTASNFPYQQDFEDRIEEIVNEKTKKVSVISSNEGQSKNIFKQVDELKANLGMSEDARFLYEDTVIQSQDQERTTMIIYNTFPNPEDPLADIEVEVYQFENRAAYPSKKVRDQIKLVQYIKNKENIEYGTKSHDKRLQADVDMYYMNSTFKNVVSSPSNIQTHTVYQQDGVAKKTSADQYLNHQLAKADKLRYVLVESKNGTYHNIKIKQDAMKGKIHFQCYFKNKFFYTFVFCLIDDSQKLSRKHNYFFVKKTTKEVDMMGQDNTLAIVTPSQELTVVVYNDMFSTMSQKEIEDHIERVNVQRGKKNTKSLMQYYTEKYTYEQLLQYHTLEQNYHVNLTFETLIDQKQELFYIPVIFQEKNTVTSSNLMIFDVYKQEFVQKININPGIDSRNHMRRTETGFVEYTLTRTSDVYETELTIFEKYDITEDMGKIQTSKYQISTQFFDNLDQEKQKPSESMLILSEYLVKYTPKSTSVLPIGLKSVLLSEACRRSRVKSFDKLMILPFITKDYKFSGSQIVLQEEGLKSEHAEPEKFRGLYLLDQEQNNLYHLKSDLAQFGYQKFFLAPENIDEYILVVSSQLSQKVYLKGNLDPNETYFILSKLQQKLMSMRLENPEVQADLKQMLTSHFYQPLEILQGKSLNDIALSFPQDVANGLKIKENVYKQISGSLISEICKGNQNLYNFYKMMGLSEENKIIQTDFTFCTTLRLGMEMNLNESVKLILNHIFKLNRKEYNDLVQLDLPKTLEFANISRIFPFLGRSHEEYMAILDDQLQTHYEEAPRQEFCALEDYLNHPELPPYQQKREQFHIKKSYTDFHNAEEETVREVIAKDPHMTWGLHGAKGTGEKLIRDKNVEAEHSIIDFQKLIIGEKIRGYTEDDFRNIDFNHEHLADIICIKDDSGQNIKYYDQETVRKLIDFQFKEVKEFLQTMFWIYIIGFQIPFLYSLTLKGQQYETQFLGCYISCLITQIIMILQEFAQLKEQGTEYFKDYYNLIDSSQFVVFLLTFFIRIISTNDDATILILLEGILMFQSFNKVFYFVRIYEDFNFILIMATTVALEVLPFATFTFGIMVGIAKIYEMLELDVNQSEQFEQYNSQYIKILFQTYQSAKGDKIPPTLSEDIQDRLQGDATTEGTLYGTIMMVWAFEQIYYFIMLTFYTAQLFQSFERTYSMMQTYQYMTKARFNEETYQVMALIKKPANFKAILFSMDKTLKGEKEKEWQGIAASLSSLMKTQKNENHDKEVAAKKNRQQMKEMEAESVATLQEVHDENVRIQRGLGQIFIQLKGIGAR